MAAPERLNVLLSRARNALIMIGNIETFSEARKGHDTWSQLFGLLREDGHVYDGFPVKCERHTDRHNLLKEPGDFDHECPDGGCKEPWLAHPTFFILPIADILQRRHVRLRSSYLSPALPPAI